MSHGAASTASSPSTCGHSGHLPEEAWGERGVDDGLCVSLRTHTHLRLEVKCNGTLLATKDLGEGGHRGVKKNRGLTRLHRSTRQVSEVGAFAFPGGGYLKRGADALGRAA